MPSELLTESAKTRPHGAASVSYVAGGVGADQRTFQNRGAVNIRSHWRRNTRRIAVLSAADLGTFFLVRFLLDFFSRAVPIEGISAVFSTVVPDQLLRGWSLPVAVLTSFALVGSYGPGDKRRDAGRVLSATGLAGLMCLYMAAWSAPAMVIAAQFGALVVLLAPPLYWSRKLVDRLVGSLRSRIGEARVVLVANAEEGDGRLCQLVAAWKEARVVTTVYGNGRGLIEEPDRALALRAAVEQEGADTVLVWGEFCESDFRAVVDLALANGCRLVCGPGSLSPLDVEPRPLWVDGRLLVELTAPALQAWQLAIKRFIDIAGSAIGLIFLSPILLLIAVWIKLDSPGPVLFGHMRLGARGARFRCCKFRSMRHDAEKLLREDPELYALYRANHFKLPRDRDPRLTRVGRVLRATSLDELPQLLNVLLGHMSLVGPRPIVPEELSHYGGGAALLLSLKPGMTGAWAVSGRSDVGYPGRAELELEYVRKWSVLNDIRILLRTVPIVVRGRGAH